jgi:hypothetical protein
MAAGVEDNLGRASGLIAMKHCRAFLARRVSEGRTASGPTGPTGSAADRRPSRLLVSPSPGLSVCPSPLSTNFNSDVW